MKTFLFVICSMVNDEHLMVYLTICTLLTAILTLVFTVKTFKSQRNTEENTSPVFTHKKQFEAFECIAYSLLCGLYDTFVIQYKLKKKCRDDVLPEELLFPIAHIDSSEIHLELFFKKENNTSPNHNKTEYTILRMFKDELVSYNNMFDVVSNQVQNKTVSRDAIEQLLDTIISETFGMLNSVVEVTSYVFDGLDDEEKKYKKEIQNHIFWDVFVTMLTKYENNNTKSFIVNFPSNLSELKDDSRSEFEKLDNNMDELDELLKNTEKKWEKLMEDYRYPEIEKNYYGKRKPDAVIFDFAKLIVAKKIIDEANDYPTISYNVT